MVAALPRTVRSPSSLLVLVGAVAQAVGGGEVSPEGAGQVLDLLVAGVLAQLLHPAEEVGRGQGPVGDASFLPGGGGGGAFAGLCVLCSGQTQQSTQQQDTQEQAAEQMDVHG